MLKNIVKSFVTVIIVLIAIGMIVGMAYVDYMMLFDGGLWVGRYLVYVNTVAGYAAVIAISSVIYINALLWNFVLNKIWK